MSRPLPLKLKESARPPIVATRLPYFPLPRARALDIRDSSCSSVDTLLAPCSPTRLPTPTWDDDEMFILTDDDDEEEDGAISDPEPMTSSSLSTQTERRTASDTLLPTIRTTRRVTSATTLPGLVSTPRPTPAKSVPCSPSLTPTIAIGQAGELVVPALERPPLVRRCSSANVTKPVVAVNRTRGWTLGQALPVFANFLGLSPSSRPATPSVVEPVFAKSHLVAEPDLTPAYVTRIEVTFCPSSPAARTCRQLIIKLRRLSDSSTLSSGVSTSTSLYSRPPRIVTHLTSAHEAAQARIRVIYSNGRRRDFDPDVGSLVILKEIEETTRNFSTLV